MADRAELHQRFAARFHFGEAPARADAATLDQAEDALDTLLPASYREFVITAGVVFTPDLWDAVVDSEISEFAPREFLPPKQVQTDTAVCWSGGMPQDLIGFAVDFMGNMFVFPRVSRNLTRPDDLPVLVFDHDYVTTVLMANSFDGWLQEYLDRFGSTATPLA